jgi:hypothetical protein
MHVQRPHSSREAERGLQVAPLIDGATPGGTVPMLEWIGDGGTTAFSY